jgi:hypothetical protein
MKIIKQEEDSPEKYYQRVRRNKLCVRSDTAQSLPQPSKTDLLSIHVSKEFICNTNSKYIIFIKFNVTHQKTSSLRENA